MRLGVFPKAPLDLKRYSINYDHWLDTGELLQSVTYAINGPDTSLNVQGLLIDPTATILAFFIGGGVVGYTYTVTFVVTTTGNQTKEDFILVQVNE